MNETHYLEVCSQATDKFMEMMGMDFDMIVVDYADILRDTGNASITM